MVTIRVRFWKTSRTPGRHREVDVALPVALLDVGEAVPLLRQGTHRLRQDREARRLERELARLRAGRGPLRRDDVADVEELEDLEPPLPDLVLLDPHLELARAIADPEERRLPERADREDAPRERPVPGVLLDLLGGRVAVPRDEVGGEVARRDPVSERVHAERAQRLGLLGALRDDLALGRAQVVAGRGGGGGLLVSHPSGLSGEIRGARLIGPGRPVNARLHRRRPRATLGRATRADLPAGVDPRGTARSEPGRAGGRPPAGATGGRTPGGRSRRTGCPSARRARASPRRCARRGSGRAAA